MKRIVTLLFVIVFLFNITGYYMGFVCMKYSIHSEMYEKATKYNDYEGLSLVKIPQNYKHIADFRFVEDNEFIYKGEYFDIVTKKVVNDTIYYYCFNDSKETSLWQSLDKHINTYNDINSSHQKKNQNIVKSMIKEWFFENKHNIANIDSDKLLYPSFYITKYSIFTEVLTPPPQSFI